MIIKPCHVCHRSKDCPIRAAKLAKVKGAGLTSMAFICREWHKDFPPGMRVRARLEYVIVGQTMEDQEHWEPLVRPAELLATVMRWKPNGKVLICVDDNQEAGKTQAVVFPVRSSRLTALGEIVPVCVHCGLPKGRELDGWVCRSEYEMRSDYYGENVEYPCSRWTDGSAE